MSNAANSDLRGLISALLVLPTLIPSANHLVLICCFQGDDVIEFDDLYSTIPMGMSLL